MSQLHAVLVLTSLLKRSEVFAHRWHLLKGLKIVGEESETKTGFYQLLNQEMMQNCQKLMERH